MFFNPKQYLRTKGDKILDSKKTSQQMTDTASVLERLDLASYAEDFARNGFESWEDVLDITEADLVYLRVKIGHRRRLQREIANQKGVSIEYVINASSERANSTEPVQANEPDGRHARSESGGAGGTGKRRYRRHPKPDKNAPERPPSAYVLFSNQIREELKPQQLSFTDIAKVVGERWQQLDTAGRDPFESRASQMKDEFNAKMAEYKKTDEWREYQNYLSNFKIMQAQNASSSGEGKRLKLERAGESSHGSSRGSAGTPTASSHGSPISLSSSHMQISLPESTGASKPSPTSAGFMTFGQQRITPATRRGGTPPSRAPFIGQAGLAEQGQSLAPSTSQFTAPPPVSATGMHHRRANNPAPPFLHQREATETSAESTSSHFSSTSQSSGTYTPLTPVDTASSYINSRPLEGEHTPTYPQQSLNRLSIGSLASKSVPPDPKPPLTGFSLPPPQSLVSSATHEQVPRILPLPSQSVLFPPAASSRAAFPPAAPLPLAASPPHQPHSMDGISILALAGSMLDGEKKDEKPRPP